MNSPLRQNNSPASSPESALPWFLAKPDPAIYLSDNYVVLDFETDTSAGQQNYGHSRHKENQLLLSCWKFPCESICAQWGNELKQRLLYLMLIGLQESGGFIVAHNAKYELGWLKRMGVDLRKVLVFDTKIAEYVLLGNLAAGSKELGMPPRSTSLEMCCRRRGLPTKDPVVDTMIKNGVNPVHIPRPWLQGRCEQDVNTTEQVFLSQRTELQRRGLLPVLFTRCLLTPVLAEIEQEGLCVDPTEVEKAYGKYRQQRHDLQLLMDEFTGGINTRSPQQMAQFLYAPSSAGGLGFKELANKRGEPKRNQSTPDFPAGVPLTDQKTLEKLAATTKRQREFLVLHKELSKAKAMLSKNLDFYHGVCEEYEGRFFGEIHQTSTATQRTASIGAPLTFKKQLDDKGEPTTRRVQLQNTPRILKKLFKAKRPGWLMAEPDGSQIEFRCAALLGNDERAIADIADPAFDAHVQTASVMYGMTKEEVLAEKYQSGLEGKDDLRQLCKPDTYKPLYGGRYGTPQQEKYYAWFRQHYAGIAKAQDRWVEQAVDTKQQVTPWGLVYHWPTAKRASGGHVNCETAVDNYPIQALATAEIVPIAVVYLWHRLPEYGLLDKVALVNMVHDSVPCEVHPDAVEQFTLLAKRAFTSDVYAYLQAVYGMDFAKVPLGVGLKIGEHWGEGKERSWDIFKDGTEIQRK